MKIFARGEQAEAAEDVDDSANANVPEKILCCLRPALPSLVNLRCRHRLRKRQFGILHHHSSHQRNKEHAEDASYHDQCGRLPIRIKRPEIRPRTRQHKSWKRENRASGDSFSDGARGSGDVFLQQRALPRPQNRHRDHGGRIGRRDRDAGPQSQIGVGRSQNYRQDQAQNHGAEG